MIQLSAAAQDRLDRYLQQVRSYLQGCRSVDPDEVQRDVNEHIQRELQGSPERPRQGTCERVAQLGQPLAFEI